MKGPQLLEERRIVRSPDTIDPLELEALARNPRKALVLSLLPGLGQIYNGETSKGALYLIAAVTTLLFIVGLITSPMLLDWLAGSGFKLNSNLMPVVRQASTPLNITLWSCLYLGFCLYTAREAYDNAQQSLKGRYFARFYFGLPESASGSYLMHISMLIVLLIIGVVSIAHTPEPQKTEIEFMLEPPPDEPPPPPPKAPKPPAPKPKADPAPAPKPKAEPPPKAIEPPKPVPPTPAPVVPTDLPIVDGPAPISQPVGPPAPSTSANGGGRTAGGSNAGGGGGDGDSTEVDLSGYLAEMQRKIKAKWFPPRGNESKKIMVSFKLNRRGEVSKLRLKRSSMLAIADEAAMVAIKNASPFGPLPKGSPDEVEIKFTFDYDVFSGKLNF